MNQPQSEREKVGKDTEINEKTKVPLFTVVACVVACVASAVSASLWLNNSLNRIEQRIVAMENRTADRWTSTDMRMWTLQLRMENPSLKVPAATSAGRE